MNELTGGNRTTQVCVAEIGQAKERCGHICIFEVAMCDIGKRKERTIEFAPYKGSIGKIGIGKVPRQNTCIIKVHSREDGVVHPRI